MLRRKWKPFSDKFRAALQRGQSYRVKQEEKEKKAEQDLTAEELAHKVERIPGQLKKDLDALFRYVDKDSSGAITAEEFELLFAELGIGTTRSDMEHIFQLVNKDVNNSRGHVDVNDDSEGTIDDIEFILIMYVLCGFGDESGGSAAPEHVSETTKRFSRRQRINRPPRRPPLFLFLLRNLPPPSSPRAQRVLRLSPPHPPHRASRRRPDDRSPLPRLLSLLARQAR